MATINSSKEKDVCTNYENFSDFRTNKFSTAYSCEIRKINYTVPAEIYYTFDILSFNRAEDY